MIRTKVFAIVLVVSLTAAFGANVAVDNVVADDHPIQNKEDFYNFVQEENVSSGDTYTAEMELHETPFQDKKGGKLEIGGGSTSKLDWMRLAYKVMTEGQQK
jgi:hypothetical protein